METKRELDTNDKLLRITAVAEVLDISVRQVWRLIASEELPKPVRIGRSVKMFASDIDAYMDGLKSRR